MTLDVVLLEEPNPEKAVVLRDVSLDPSLSEDAPKRLPIDLAFEGRSLAYMGLEPNKPPLGRPSEAWLSEDDAIGSKRNSDGGWVILLLGDTPLEPETFPSVDEDTVDPNNVLVEGVVVNALVSEGVKSEPNRPAPTGSVLV